MVVKNPADFIGSVLGASESNTKVVSSLIGFSISNSRTQAILANTVGKVLVIDEVC